MEENVTRGRDSIDEWKLPTAIPFAEVKIMVMGGEDTFKAGFIADYIESELGSNWSIDPTEDIFKRYISVGPDSYIIKVFTDAGQEALWGAYDETMRNMQGLVYIYKVNSKDSLEKFQVERERIFLHKSDAPIMMVGLVEKDSTCERQVTYEEGAKMAKSFGCGFMEYAPKSGKIDAVFIQMLKIIHQSEGHYHKKSSVSRSGSISTVTELEIIIIGDIFVGKSAFIKKYTSGDFSVKYNSTQDPHAQKMTMVVDGEAYVLKLVDTSGLNFLDVCTREFLSSAQGIILMYSVTSLQSFWMLEQLKKKVLSLRLDSLPFMIIGTKTDIPLGRLVSTRDGELMAKRLGALFMETSNKNGSPKEAMVPFTKEILRQYTSFDILGDFDKQGWLLKQEGKKVGQWKTRWFVLKDNILSFSTDITSRTFKHKLHIDEHTTIEIGAHTEGRQKTSSGSTGAINNGSPGPGTPTIGSPGGLAMSPSSGNISESTNWRNSIALSPTSPHGTMRFDRKELMEALDVSMTASSPNLATSVAQYPFTVTSYEEGSRKLMSFVLIASSEDQRSSWVKSIKSSKALAEVGNLVSEDVLRMMLWEIASNSLATYNSEGSTTFTNKRASVYSPHLTIGRNRNSVNLSSPNSSPLGDKRTPERVTSPSSLGNGWSSATASPGSPTPDSPFKSLRRTISIVDDSARESVRSKTFIEKTKNAIRKSGTLTRTSGQKLAAQVREMNRGKESPKESPT